PVLSSFSCTFDSRSPSSFPTRRSSDLVIFIVVTIGIFWAAGERAKWSPDFSAQPLAANVVKNDNPAVVEGARLFHDKGCEFCHRSEEHTSELQSPDHLVCRLLLEKKKN